ncbi:hypothetical protein Tco_0567151, partial [Tanacetum coccineum]
RIGMKAVKEKEQLQKTVDSWNDSSKNLWRLINSGMSSNDKLGLGGDYAPKPQEEIDDSLYVYGKKGPQQPEISMSDENSSEHSTCQSNDSEGSCENTSEYSFETESESVSEPSEMSKSRLDVANEKDVSALKSKEVEPSCVSHIKTPRQPLKDKETHKFNRKNWNDMMERELGKDFTLLQEEECFVLWIKHANLFVPRSVLLNASSQSLILLGTNDLPLVVKGMCGIVVSGCSGHMTGYKGSTEDFEEGGLSCLGVDDAYLGGGRFSWREGGAAGRVWNGGCCVGVWEGRGDEEEGGEEKGEKESGEEGGGSDGRRRREKGKGGKRIGVEEDGKSGVGWRREGGRARGGGGGEESKERVRSVMELRGPGSGKDGGGRKVGIRRGGEGSVCRG